MNFRGGGKEKMKTAPLYPLAATLIAWAPLTRGQAGKSPKRWERDRQMATRQMLAENEIARIRLATTLVEIDSQYTRETDRIMARFAATRAVERECFNRSQADKESQIKSIREQARLAAEELAKSKSDLAELLRLQAESQSKKP